MTTTRQFKTNLRCGSCVATITPYLDRVPGLDSWKVDVASPDKTLTVAGNAPAEAVKEAVSQAGYQVIADVVTPPAATVSEPPTNSKPAATYFPLLLLVAFLVAVVGLVEVRIGSFAWHRAMGNFMGAFFLAVSFFKLLDLRGFADNYRGYDVVARRIPVYGYVYPFIELLLGAAYLAAFQPFATNLVTLVVMVVSSIGVIQSLLNKRKIRCACLGTVFNLPMSTVTFAEDGLMVAMAAGALLGGGLGTV